MHFFIFPIYMSEVIRSVAVGECSSGDIAIFIILSIRNRKMALKLLLVFI